MRRMNRNFRNFHWGNVSRFAALAIFVAACFPARLPAQQAGQKTFSSAEEATKALVAAVRSDDEKAMLEILGPEDKEIVSSGDATQDAQSRADFAKKYDEMHRLVREPAGTMLYIGAENWPTPIPIVNKDKIWYFDTPAGKMEILFRRVGRNELSAIRVCEELVAAQKEYFAAQHGEYARAIFSEEGKHDGLYWKAAAGEPESPIGPLVAMAVAEGYDKGRPGPPNPYRGYLFHILTRQGKSAAGGAKDYVVNGKMTGGFAFVAYPAEYRSSGVMTFVVGADGVVYQKDLGKKTEAVGDALKDYNPDSKWEKTGVTPEQTADAPKTK